jgi:hypothetical protein
MPDQIGTRRLGSFSSIEILSVVAVILIIVMIAIPVPYTSWNHGFPASQATLSRGYVAADTRSGDTFKSADEGNKASLGSAFQGSPFEVRTVGQRQFCADQPGLVRFRTTGPSCKNGTLDTNTQPHREQTRR